VPPARRGERASTIGCPGVGHNSALRPICRQCSTSQLAQAWISGACCGWAEDAGKTQKFAQLVNKAWLVGFKVVEDGFHRIVAHVLRPGGGASGLGSSAEDEVRRTASPDVSRSTRQLACRLSTILGLSLQANTSGYWQNRPQNAPQKGQASPETFRPDYYSRCMRWPSSLFRGAVLNLARISCDHRQQM